ncbi:MAG: DUF2634 domain-containing protein [Ezakiella sp.]|nr:DUF2634 domain-containing protein [Ezakiella sp.]
MIPEVDKDINELLKDKIEIEKVKPSKTYRMDIVRERIIGHCDGIEALKQAIYKELNTEKGEYVIYGDYGLKKKDLFGKEKRWAYMILTDRIRECLIDDDRINDVHSFLYIDDMSRKDNLCLSFVVDSIYGEFEVDRLVLSL